MPDFSDSYFEELKKKIRSITEDRHQRHKLSPSKEEQESPVVENVEKKIEMPVVVPSAPEKDTSLTVETNQKPANGDGHKNAIIFSLKNQVTGLVRALRVFQVT